MRLQFRPGRLYLLMLLGLCSPGLPAAEQTDQHESSGNDFVALLEFLGEFSTEEDGWIDPFEFDAPEVGRNEAALKAEDVTGSSTTDTLPKESESAAKHSKDNPNLELVDANSTIKR